MGDLEMTDRIILGVSSIIIGLTTIITTQILDPPKMIKLSSNWCSTVALPPPDYLGGGLTILGVIFIATGIVYLLASQYLEDCGF